ncbi:unnamed protein product [Cunninghamella echinulata]
MNTLKIITNKDILQAHITKITSLLALELWRPNRQHIINSLVQVKDWSIEYKGNSLEQYLEVFMLAIFNEINKIMSEDKMIQSIDQYNALISLKILLDMMNTRMLKHISQLVSMAQSIMDNIKDPIYIYELWNSLLKISTGDDSNKKLGDIIRGMLHIYPLCDSSIRTKIVEDITHSIKSQTIQDKTHFLDQLPDLPIYEEFIPLKQWLAGERSSITDSDALAAELREIMDHIQQQEIIPSIETLYQIYRLLTIYPPHLILYNCPYHKLWTILQQLYSVLLNIIKNNADRYDICDIAASCLGLLGAIDPYRLSFKETKGESEDQNENDGLLFFGDNNHSKCIVMDNFDQNYENQLFVLDLIVHYILPTFHSVTKSDNEDRMSRQYSQYCIQELLKSVDITPQTLNLNSSHHHHQHFHQKSIGKLWATILNDDIKDILTPLLYSKFTADIETHQPSLPVYEILTNWSSSSSSLSSNTSIFDEWLSSFFYLLLERESISIKAKTLFQACIPLVKTMKSHLTQHLIPFLVLHLLINGNELDQKLIMDEIIGTLKINDREYSPTIQTSLKVIVAITEHCRTWMKRKQQQNISITASHQRVIRQVKRFLNDIPNDLMAKAAFRSGAYAHALMHLELFIKTSIEYHGSITSDILDNLSQIYIHMEEPANMNAVLTLYTRQWSRQQEIHRFECLNDWNYVKLCYEDLLETMNDNNNNDDNNDNNNNDKKNTIKSTATSTTTTTSEYLMDITSIQRRYIRCLKELGDYNRMIAYTYPRKNNPEMNGYCLEAAWKTSQWQLLHQLKDLPMEEKFDSLLARSLGHMQSNNKIGFYLDLYHAKSIQINNLCHSGYRSYHQSYDTILNLQLIHELESIYESRDDQFYNDIKVEKKEVDYQHLIWKAKFLLTKPSYRTQRKLLELRIAAKFGTRELENVSTKISNEEEKELWLLLAKAARKSGDMNIALKSTYASYSELELKQNLLTFKQQQPPVKLPTTLVDASIEHAKWYFKQEDTKMAIQILENPVLSENSVKIKTLLCKYRDHAKYSPKLTQNILFDARKLDTFNEKVFFESGKFYDRMIEDRKLDVSKPVRFYRFAQTVTELYIQSLEKGSTYYYHAMSKVLSIWFRFVDDRQGQTNDKAVSNAINEGYASINNLLTKYTNKLQPYQFGLILPRLVSRLAIEDSEVVTILMNIILKVFITYPRTTIWQLQSALNANSANLQERATIILENAEKSQQSPLISSIIMQTRELTRYLNLIAKEDFGPDGRTTLTKFPGLLQMKDLEVCIPQEIALLPRIPDYPQLYLPSSTLPKEQEHEPYPPDLPRIQNIVNKVTVMRSLQQPKRITLMGTDGRNYHFLSKKNDDLRKDARMMEFSYMINKFLRKQQTTHADDYQLYIRTYAVIPLGENWGLIEWINNLEALKHIVGEEWKTLGIDIKQMSLQIRQLLDSAKELEAKKSIFTNAILPKCPAVFYKWFLNHFPEPSQWYTSRSRYIKTLAVMSIVGYVIGLGDRHAENLLFDSTTGDTVHVDVNMLFDRGQSLTVPEIVPFRLTNNLIDAMGVTKTDGMFHRACVLTLLVLRKHKVQLLSVFESLSYDPIIDWRKRHNRVDARQMTTSQMDKMRKKISGADDNDHIRAEDVIDDLIDQASSPRNLAQMFIGWAAFV